MPLKLKCRCGQLLKVPDQSAGQVVRCPRCQTQLRVAVAPVPALPEADPFADLPVAIPIPSTPRVTAAPARRQTPLPRSRPVAGGGKKAVIAGSLIAGAIAVGSLAIWWLLPLFRGTGLIEDRFTPIGQLASGSGQVDAALANASAGRNATESAMLAIAGEFIRHARKNQSREAIAMIDATRFHDRLYSAKGSYDAMAQGVPAAKLLGNFGGFALDGAPVGRRRHWHVVGISEFDGSPGVVLRYYVEPQTPLDLLIEPELFQRLGQLVTYDQVAQKAKNLFTHDVQSRSYFDSRNLTSHPIQNAFTAHVGYMMLLFDCQEAAPRLVDLVNVLGQSSLSQTGTQVFLADYHVIGGLSQSMRFSSREAHGTKPSTITIYGVSDRVDLSWDASDPTAEQRARQKHAVETEAVEQRRPKRLEHLVSLWRSNSPALNEELERFRKDFPSDLGFELAIVIHKMVAARPTFTAADDALIVPACRALYRQWKDPFFLLVEGLCAAQNGRPADANALFAQCAAAGFVTTASSIARIQDAVGRSDSAEILALLEDWNRAWAHDGLVPAEEKLATLAARYEELEQTLNPQPLPEEAVASELPRQRSGPGRSSRFRTEQPEDAHPSGRPPAADDFARGHRFANPGPSTSSPQSPDGHLPPGRNRGPMRGMEPRRAMVPPPTGMQISIKISSTHSFDSQQIIKTLTEKLGIQHYGFSQSNREATINIFYAGSFQSVVEAIEFGDVDAADEATRTIIVTIR